MSDSLNTGRKIRTFNVIDDYNRKCLGIEVDHSLPAQRVIKSLEQLIEWRGKPKAIRCDNGPEYISHALREWAQAMDMGYIITNDLIVRLVGFYQESYLRLFKQWRFYF
jgi:putative transposase